jgi:alpha-tubulin suppressor-like RCC1 family protein
LLIEHWVEAPTQTRLSPPPLATQQPPPLHELSAQQACPGSPQGEHTLLLQTRFAPPQVRPSQQACPAAPQGVHVRPPAHVRPAAHASFVQHVTPLVPHGAPSGSVPPVAGMPPLVVAPLLVPVAPLLGPAPPSPLAPELSSPSLPHATMRRSKTALPATMVFRTFIPSSFARSIVSLLRDLRRLSALVAGAIGWEKMGRHGFLLLSAACVLVACNAIIGVEDVRQKSGVAYRDGGSSGSSSGATDDDDDVIGAEDGGPTAPKLPMLALGSSHTCARMTNGTVRCWGEARLGQLGDAANLDAGTDPDDVLKPKEVPGLTDATSITAGANHTCVIRKGGKVSCWGYNYSGQLGTGNKSTSSSPLDVVGLTDATQVSGGFTATCAIHTDKTASCWGDNDNGQLGDGTKNESTKPVKVKDLTGVKSIAVGTQHTCAIVEPADVYCWGDNAKGQLGNGSTDPSPEPVKVGGLSDAVEIVMGASFTCARETNGRVSCWGQNDVGQLGNGVATTNPNPSPVLVAQLSDAKAIGAGLQHACAVRASGEVACWGAGDFGQLGSGKDAGTAVLEAVADVKDARFVWGGAFRSCVIRTGSGAECWGSNTSGELGNGSTDRAYLPVPVVDFP